MPLPGETKERLIRAFERSMTILLNANREYGHGTGGYNVNVRFHWRRLYRKYPYEALLLAQKYSHIIKLEMPCT